MCDATSANNYLSDVSNREIERLRSDDCKLFHYTSLKGLTGILTSKHLWLNPYHNLEDESEINHAKELFLEVIKECISNEPFDDVKQRFEILFHQYRYISACISFCSAGSSDYMWKEYGLKHGKEDPGVLIKFNTKLAFGSPDELKVLYYMIQYGDTPCRDFFKEMIERQNCDRSSGFLCKDCYVRLITGAMSVLPKFKKEKFLQESEHRICYTAILFPKNSTNSHPDINDNNYDFNPYGLDRFQLH